MPFFKYVARDRSGKQLEERVEAVSQEEVVGILQARDLFVVSIGPAGEEKKVKRSTRRYHHGIKADDLIMFSRELATLLSSGVTLIKCLDILIKQMESQMLLRALEQIKKDVEGGYTFQNALKKHTKIFSEFWIHLVETGEASGHLPASLEQLAGYMEESAALKKKVATAMVYPIILITVAAGAISIFLIKIIPVFAEIFKGFDMELPLLTQMIIDFSNVVKKYFLLGVGSSIGLFFILKKYISTDKGRWQFDGLKLKLPLVGPMFYQICTERFASSLSTLIKTGVPILHALDITQRTVGNKIVEKELNEVKIAVREGRGMAQTMEDSAFFPPLVVQMIGVGEEIGELGKMLDRIAVFYKDKVDTFVTRITTLIEPLVLVFMGVIVGILVVGMFLPIFTISSAVKG